jgi:hypothetical protein
MSSKTMTEKTSSRRAFLKVGAIAAAPLAAAAPAAFADPASFADPTRARLQRLEDEAAIRDLHRGWLGRNPKVTPSGEPDAITVAVDGRSATGRFACKVEIEAELPRDCTFAQMAHAQGNGAFRSTEHRVLTVSYVKAAAGWIIARVDLT